MVWRRDVLSLGEQFLLGNRGLAPPIGMEFAPEAGEGVGTRAGGAGISGRWFMSA